MSQLCFDRFSLIINVVLLCAALEVIAPVSTVPTQAGFDSYTWWEKHSTHTHPPHHHHHHLILLPCVYLSISPSLYLSLSLLWLVSKGSQWRFHTFIFFCARSLTHTNTHTHTELSAVSPEWFGYGGMCHSSIIDQIQLLSSTDHLVIHHCLCLMQTRSHFHTHALHSLKCPLFHLFLHI